MTRTGVEESAGTTGRRAKSSSRHRNGPCPLGQVTGTEDWDCKGFSPRTLPEDVCKMEGCMREGARPDSFEAMVRLFDQVAMQCEAARRASSKSV